MYYHMRGNILNKAKFNALDRLSIVDLLKMIPHFDILASYRRQHTVCIIWGLMLLLNSSWATASVPVVQFFNASVNSNPFLTSLDVYVNGNLFADDLTYGSASIFLEVPPLSSTTVTVAPKNSNTAADGFYSQVCDFSAPDGRFMVVFTGESGNTSQPFQLVLKSDIKLEASDPTTTELMFVHATQSVGGLDVVLRSGPMILGNLEFKQSSGYLAIAAIEQYIDVKATGTSDIISTYRLSLNVEQGRAFVIVISGDASTATALKLVAVYNDGVEIPIDYAPVARVQYINALQDSVDIFKNGSRFADDVSQGHALMYKYIPAGIVMNIAITNQNSINSQNPISSTPFTFGNMTSYTAVSAGTMDSPVMMFAPMARERAQVDGTVDIRCFNADYQSTDWTVQVLNGTNSFGATSYGGVSEYATFDPVPLSVQVSSADGSRSYTSEQLDLVAKTGQSLTLLVTPSENANSAPQLWLIGADAVSTKVVLQPVSSQTIVNSDALLVFPNPVQERLFIKTERVLPTLDFRIFDQQGKAIKTGIILPESGFIDVSALSQGSYYIQLFNKEKQIGLTQKIIK
jgi:hypothetical protein